MRIRNIADWMGRIGITFAVLLVAYVVMGFAAPRSLLRPILLLGIAVTGVWFAIRIGRRTARHAVWRLRNRLLVTYLFMAIVPIVLIVSLAATSGYWLLNQLAVYLVTSELDRRIESLAETARRIAEVDQDRRAEVVPFLLGGSGTEVLVRSGGKQFRFPSTSNLPPPRDGWPSTRGFLIRNGSLFLWDYTRFKSGDVTQVMPVTREFLAGLAPDLGVVGLSGSVGRTVKLARPADTAAAAPREMPPSASRFDMELLWFAPIPFVDWDHPGTVTAEPTAFQIYVRTRISAVLAAVFNRSGDVAQNFIQIVLVIGLITFALVEILSLIVGIGFTRTITGAVHRLYEGTRRVTVGDFSHRIEAKGSDQLAELGQSFNRMTGNIEHLLTVAKEKERLQSEVEIARQVQDHLFPREALRARTLRVAAVCRPARMVSGDYYDYAMVRESQVALALGDVAGKGISAALLMATLQSSLRTDLQGSRNGTAALSTSALVSRLNRQLYANTSPEKYATFCLGLFDEVSGMLTYTNAGHLPPLLVREGEVTRLDVNGTVVGAFDFAHYDESSVPLARGDLLVFFTDGVTEPENSYGEMYGEERFTDLIARNFQRDEQEILDVVVAALREWTGSDELQDDLTLLLARRT